MTVPHALLALLERGPCYGLRLKEEFESWTGEVWPLNVGQVYTTLQRLERDGYVAAAGEEHANQRLYSLTRTGRGELRRWLNTPAADATPPRDELVIKVLMALAVPGVDPHDVIQAHRRDLVEQLQGFTRAKAALPDGELAGTLVLDAQIFRTEAMVRWLDLCESRLDRGARLETPSTGRSPDAGEAPRRRAGSRASSGRSKR